MYGNHGEMPVPTCSMRTVMATPTVARCSRLSSSPHEPPARRGSNSSVRIASSSLVRSSVLVRKAARVRSATSSFPWRTR